MSLKKICAFTLLFIFGIVFQLSAQSNRKISGSVTDSTKTAIPYAKVLVIFDKDTLKTETGEDGNFTVPKIRAANFSVLVSTFGYEDFKASYTFTEKETHMRLGPIKLKMSGQTLKEVVISSKPNPVRVMQDTVEYNAGAFRVNEGDNMADLLKQLPGMEVDDKYNVKVMNKAMVKLRVNGKDFFTGDVKEFIGKLPAGIVSKIQVIDDFGDEANFTGIKKGEPVKMLNIVTKPGMNKSIFGLLSANAATNDMVGSSNQISLWNDDKQSTVRANASTSNNGAGNSRQLSFGLGHNDKLGKYSKGGLNYSFDNNSDAFNREQVAESLNPEGNFTNNTRSEGNNGNRKQNLKWNMDYNDKEIFMQANVEGSYNRSTNQNTSFSRQSGLLRQDLNNIGSSDNSLPSLSADISASKKLKNKKDILSVNTAFSFNGSRRAEQINTNTLYYDKDTEALVKDSALNRNVDSKLNDRNFSFGFNYSLGLKKTKDSLGRQSLSFSYNGAARWSANEVSTFVLDNMHSQAALVDSLSTSFSSTSFNQSFGLNYNYGSPKMRYNLNFSAVPNLLSNRDLRLGQTIINNTFNYLPSINFSRTLAVGKTLSLNYRGTNQNPTIDQLQPIRNAQSLQNILVGNPDLKPSFKQDVSSNFNYVHTKSGLSAQVGMSASMTQKEIVNHVMLLPDTLNSLKQVTRYENVNGNYEVAGNYLINVPIAENKYSFNYSGNLGFSKRAVIFNGQKAYGKGLNLSQQLEGKLSVKKLMLNAKLNYSVTNNNNASSLYGLSALAPIGIGQINGLAFFKTTTLGTSLTGNLTLEKLKLNTSVNYNASHNDATADQAIQDNADLNMSLMGQVTIRKSYFIDFAVMKRVNYGYVLANSNPLLLNAGIGKRFLKNKSLILNVSGNDLLGQGNNIFRMVSGNTIIDSRNQQPTRVFAMSLSYNISRFGGKNFRVDAD